jgi:hypothetical protein
MVEVWTHPIETMATLNQPRTATWLQLRLYLSFNVLLRASMMSLYRDLNLRFDRVEVERCWFLQ